MRKQLSLTVLSLLLLFFYSCKKQSIEPGKELLSVQNSSQRGHLQQTKTFSSEVIVRWLNMQLEMLRTPLAAGASAPTADRAMAYCGIATYESVVPGMPAYQSLVGQLNGFPVMPETEPGQAYHWAACANAALAEMSRKLFPNASAANKTNMNNLETLLQERFANETNPQTLARSIAFGKEVALRVFAWAATDGTANVNPPYVPPVGPGLWQPTPPNFPAAVNPYLYQRRLIVPGVASGTTLTPPPPYSTDPASPFFNMVRDVYDKSQNLSPAQTAMAIYHRDNPGYPGGGHFIAVLSQIFDQTQATLDVAALAYAKSGIAFCDANTIGFTYKYTFNLVRPITYIRNIMGYSGWNALFNTPGHPEFPSAHAVNGAAVAYMFASVLGDNFQFTDHTYDYLGLPARSYNSFHAWEVEMADSRVYAGIHYQESCDKGRWLGEKVSQNVLGILKFLKD